MKALRADHMFNIMKEGSNIPRTFKLFDNYAYAKKYKLNTDITMGSNRYVGLLESTMITNDKAFNDANEAKNLEILQNLERVTIYGSVYMVVIVDADASDGVRFVKL